MTVHFDKEYELDLGFDKEKLVRQVIEYATQYAKCPYEIEVGVLFTDDNQIAQINKEHRDIDHPTDVLSFPLVSYEYANDFSVLENSEMDFNPDSGELMLGDIIISLDKVVEQANRYGHALERELAFLTAHSMLHLFGYDHMDDEQREVMETKQGEILRDLKIYR